MPGLAPVDAAFRIAFRLGFPLARIWWRLAAQVMKARSWRCTVDRALLLVRSSYRARVEFPRRLDPARRDARGGGAARIGRGGRPPRTAARSRRRSLGDMGRAERSGAFLRTAIGPAAQAATRQPRDHRGAAGLAGRAARPRGDRAGRRLYPQEYRCAAVG